MGAGRSEGSRRQRCQRRGYHLKADQLEHCVTYKGRHVRTPYLHTGYARIAVFPVSGQRQVRDELAEDEGPVLRRRAGDPLRGGSCFCHCSGASHAPCWLRARSEGHVPGSGRRSSGTSSRRRSNRLPSLPRARHPSCVSTCSQATTHASSTCQRQSRALATIAHPRPRTCEEDCKRRHGGWPGRGSARGARGSTGASWGSACAGDRGGQQVPEGHWSLAQYAAAVEKLPRRADHAPDIDLTALIPQLDTVASDLVTHQRDTLTQRKELAQKTKDFRKLDDESKLNDIKGLLKCEQLAVNLYQLRRPNIHSVPGIYRPDIEPVQDRPGRFLPDLLPTIRSPRSISTPRSLRRLPRNRRRGCTEAHV